MRPPRTLARALAIPVFACAHMFPAVPPRQVEGPALQSRSPLAFDVASVKRSREGSNSLLQATAGRLSATGLTLKRLLLIAYDIQDFQVSDLPSWVSTERYDINARAVADATTEQMEGPMLQQLLAERVQLRSHRETRLLPVYELTLAEKGAKLHASDTSRCKPYVKTAQPAGAPDPAAPQLPFCGFHRIAEGERRTLDGRGVSLDDLAVNLSHSYNTSLEKAS